MRRTNTTSGVLAIAALVASSAVLGTALAQTKTGSPKTQDNLAIAEEHAKQLLLLIDTGKSGKISKQEWMRFMEAEFDRLDVEKNGALDVKELAHSKLVVSHFATAGK